MGLKLCFFVMNVRGDARPRRPILEAMPNLLELWLADFFAPRVLNFWLDGTRAYELARLDPTQRIGTQPLWTDETVIEASALTHCGPAGSSPLTGRWHGSP